MTRLVCFVVLTMLLVACGNSKWERMDAVQSVPLSYASVDIKLPMGELEVALNKLISTQMYKDGFPINKKRDSLFLDIRRTRNMRLSFENGRIGIKAPVEVQAVIKKKVFGVWVSNASQPLKFKALAKMSTGIDLGDKWDFQYSCRWDGLQWEQEPMFNVLGFKLDLSEFVEKQLTANKAQLEGMLCDLLTQKIDSKKAISKIYTDMQKPVRVTKIPVPLYLHSNPLGIRGGISESSPKDTLVLHLEQQTALSIKPSDQPEGIATIPSRENIINEGSALSSFVAIHLPFNVLENTMNDLVSGEVFTYDEYQGQVTSVKVSEFEGRMKLELTLTGDFEGIIHVFATPDVDDDLIFGLESLDYELIEAQQWAKVTDMAFHKAVEKMIVSKVKFDTAPFFESLGEQAKIGIDHSPLGEKIDIDLSLSQFSQYSKGIDQDQIQFIFQIDGSAELILKSGAFSAKKKSRVN